MTLYHELKHTLMQGGIEEGEAKAIALLLLEKVAGMTTAEALTAEPIDNIGTIGTIETTSSHLISLARRIAQGEPVQYVLGEADFCGLTFKVAPGVLIPRPETEELVAWVMEELKPECQMANVKCKLPTDNCKLSTVNSKLLDIGTGSGCIAIALAKHLPHAYVEAWDISPDALRIAQENATRHNVDVVFRQLDILENLESLEHLDNLDHLDAPPFSIIVSNPPYICQSEAGTMEAHVLDHEPHTALFVPDHDPLLFYRRIAELSMGTPLLPTILSSGGLLFFEVNRRFGQDVVELLEGMGFQDVELRHDQFGNPRMVKAIKPLQIRY